MEHEGVGSHTVISKVIEELARAEGKMRTTGDKVKLLFLTDGGDYASIVAQIDTALVSVENAIADVYGKLYEP